MKGEQQESNLDGGAAGSEVGEASGTSSEVAAPGSEKSDRILGIIAGVMIVLAIGLLINALVRPAITDGPPRLELLAPADGDTLTLPVTVRLSSAAPLTIQPGGWGVPGYHVHVEVAGEELMPGPNDMRPAAVGEYLWDLPTVAPGPTSMRLFWADVAHREVADGAGSAIDVVVR